MTLLSVRPPLDSPVLPRRSRPPHTQHGEPRWAIVTKWCLLGAALVLTGVTVVELIRAVKTLAEVPVSIVTTLPPMPDQQLTQTSARSTTSATLAADAVHKLRASDASAEPGGLSGSETSKPAGQQSTGPQRQPLATLGSPRADDGPNLSSAELARIRMLLERASSRHESEQRPAREPLSPTTSRPQLLAGIERTPAESRAQQHKSTSSRRREALRVSSGPKVTLIGADALVETELENRSEELQKRTVVLELRVNGRRRQQRKLRIRLAPRSKVHLSERFSTTLPDGTYSAAVLLNPLG